LVATASRQNKPFALLLSTFRLSDDLVAKVCRNLSFGSLIAMYITPPWILSCAFKKLELPVPRKVLEVWFERQAFVTEHIADIETVKSLRINRKSTKRQSDDVNYYPRYA
jgi:hypothetical protein